MPSVFFILRISVLAGIPLNLYGNHGALNVAGFFPAATCLGPGLRSMLWLQGCLKNCPGCITPEMRSVEVLEWVDVKDLAWLIGHTEGVDGVTVMGGEPMLQTPALSQLFYLLKEDYRLSTMVYTGYTMEQLLAVDPNMVGDLCAHTDILVDGPYIKALDHSQKWRGSENQRIYFLSDEYARWKWVRQERKRDVEVHVDSSGRFLLLGIPTRQVYGAFWEEE